MGRIRVESRDFEDWRKGLADPGRHWRRGYSAYELARAWETADGFPGAVRKALVGHPQLSEAELLLGLPEYRVRLAGRGHASQVDLLVLARDRSRSDELVVVAVEGKVDETFGPTVATWRKRGGANRECRLCYLCESVGLDAGTLPGDIRYQLLHRAVSAVEAAHTFATRHAVLLVHSFSARRKGYADFERFARLLDADVAPGSVSPPVECPGADLSLGWVADRASTEDR